MLKDGAHRRDDRQAASPHRRHLHEWQAPALAHQRHPGPVQGGGRQDAARPRGDGSLVHSSRTSLSIVREKAAARRIRLGTGIVEEASASVQVDARKVKQIVYNLLSNAVRVHRRGRPGERRRPPRPARGGRAAGPVRGRVRALDWPPERVRGVPRDPRHGPRGIGISPARGWSCCSRRSARWTAASRASSRAPASAWPSSSRARRAARRHGGGRERRGRGLVLHGLAAAARCRGGAPREGDSRERPCRRRRRRRPPWSWRATSSPPRSSACSSRRTASRKVLHAASAEAALALAIKQPLSLITLDINLPEMDGWEGSSIASSRCRRWPASRSSSHLDRGRSEPRLRPWRRGESCRSRSRGRSSTSRWSRLGLSPLARGETLKVLVVDDDPRAIELIALRIEGLASHRASARVRRPGGDRDRAEGAPGSHRARHHDAGGERLRRGGGARRAKPDTARIPIVLIVTAKQGSRPTERAALNGYVTAIMAKGTFDRSRLRAEVRRAMSGRRWGA